jgi:hypothetical protein
MRAVCYNQRPGTGEGKEKSSKATLWGAAEKSKKEKEKEVIFIFLVSGY